MTRRHWQWLWLQLITTCFGVSHGEYLGCYRDPDGRLMQGYLQNFVLTLTPDRCVDVCTSKGFQYAGLKARIACLCDQQAPSQSFLSEEKLCQATCVGDNSKACGGDSALSVYTTRLAQKEETKDPAPGSFVGCYKDNNDDRLLSGSLKEFSNNSPEKCRNLCYRMGFLYAGLEFGTECFCGDSHPPPEMLRDSGQCSMPCPGSPKHMCGGSGRLSIYDTGITNIPVLGKKLGCFDDEDPRVLQDYKIELEATNSPQRCLNLCRSLGYKYSGVEYGVECFCGNNVNANMTRDSADEECNKPCPGDVFDTCGANWKLQVYRTGLSDPEPVIRKVACVRADSSQLPSGYRHDFSQSTSPEKCAKLCFNKGFLYFALLLRNQCWCGNNRPQSLSVDNKECENTQAVLYETGLFSITSNYIGCFSSLRKDITLGGISRNFETQLNPEKCSQFCFTKGYLFYGTKNKKECHCGDKSPWDILTRVTDDECSSSCSGDKSKKCGGNDKFSVYSTGITDVPTKAKLLGCFKDEVRPRTLDDHKTDLEKTNSPQRCLNYCLALGYMFAGVEYQKECFCGNTRPNSVLDAPDSQCNSVCSGDSSQTCGGGWRIQMYRTGYSVSNSGNSPDPEKPDTTARPQDNCELSETLVNGKAVCRGAVVFKDNFETSSIAGHWQHVIKIADIPDYEFVTFTADPVNSYQKERKLVIKPTLLSSKEVTEGSIKLDGCTGLAATRECEMRAFSYNILPPVRSARIHTLKSFSFRYGIVEIRAKLPAGDWIVPELWLLPKDQSYGTNYLSGKIRVAMSRGNRYLTFNGEDIGSSVLESGVMIGPENNVVTRSVVNTMSDSWNSHTHNYTLIWTPDNLSFYVDGQAYQALLPPSAILTELLGFNKSDVSAWDTGSRIAPFDTDFYLSLGVSAGGARDFPDGSINKNKEKPWSNFKLKAMLNFWLNKESWQPSWSDSKSSLIVEHVQVTAL